MAANPYQLTTRELLSILFKEKNKLIIVFVGLAAVIFGFSYLLTPYYDASTRLLVKTGREFQVRSDSTQQVASAPSVTKQEIVNSEIQILTSRDLIEAVINKLGADKLYPGLAGSNNQVMDAAVRNFLGDLKAAPIEQTDVIEASYRNTNREVAIQALGTLVDLYQQKHAEMFSDPREKFLEQQTRQYEDQLNAVVQKIVELRNSRSLFDVDAQRAKLLDDRTSLQSILQQLRSQSVDTHRRVEFLQARLKATPPLITGGEAASDAVEQAKTRLLDLQVKEQQLQERYVGDVKPLQDIRQEMERLRQFISQSGPTHVKTWSQRNGAYDDMTVALNRALADAAPLDQQIALRERQVADIDQRLRDLEEGGKSLAELDRERRTLEELTHTYRARYEEARMNENLDKEKIVSVSVVQRPDAAIRPAGPRHLPFLLGGLLVGLLGAGGMLVFLLVFRETLITVESVERVIGVPVLASVPPVNDNRTAA